MGYLFRDERLIELLAFGDAGEELALVLGRAQALVAAQTEHIIALNDEYVWRRIKAMVDGDHWRSIGVRCIGCSAVAPLGLWVASADMASDQLVEQVDRFRKRGNPYLAAVYDICDSAHRAAQMLDMLVALRRPGEPQMWVMAQGRRDR